jgi:hypothetical protein
MTFQAAVIVMIAGMVLLISTPLWWVPAAAGLGIAAYCFTQAGGG